MVYPIIYRVSNIQGGAGFLPSTVWQPFQVSSLHRSGSTMINLPQLESIWAFRFLHNANTIIPGFLIWGVPSDADIICRFHCNMIAPEPILKQPRGIATPIVRNLHIIQTSLANRHVITQWLLEVWQARRPPGILGPGMDGTEWKCNIGRGKKGKKQHLPSGY